MKDFRQLKVRQKSHQWGRWHSIRSQLHFHVLKPMDLTAQIRRAASSIPSNLVEGCGRNGDAELARFCCIARGSASELEYHLLLARDLKLMGRNDYEQLAEQTTEIKRMLTVFCSEAEC